MNLSGRAVRRYGGTRIVAALTFLAAVPPYRLTASAQCPDGSPPPCRPSRASTPALDPHRIAVLPFRVTTADTLLGEGVAELLSAEFTGESGPRAAHMGTVLRAWRRAGGSVHTPLGEAEAMRVAREIGAGLVVDGSVVGLSSRLTLTASVMTVPGGAARRVGPVSGPVDSVESLAGRLASGLLGASGSERLVDLQARLTASPSAMRAYLEGLAAFRIGRMREAAAAFERASAEDSTFARAAFMRYVLTGWGAGGWPERERWERRAWSLRDRLSPADRVLLVAYVGDSYPAPRSPWRAQADHERAAALLPESPEAQYALGDWLLHNGAETDAPHRLERAVALFQRSLALDTQETVLGHLAFTAVLRADTALVRLLRPALERRGTGVWGASWLVAAWLDDTGWVKRLLAPEATGAFEPIAAAPTGVPPVELISAAAAGVRPVLLEELLDSFQPWAAGFPRGPITTALLRFHAAVVQGRPAQATRFVMASPTTIRRDTWIVLAGLFADGDTVAAAKAVERLAAWPARDSAEAAAALCPVAIWRVSRARAAPGAEPLLRRHGQERCAVVVGLLESWHAVAPDLDQRLVVADSLLRSESPELAFESLILARGWEARGNLPRALSAIRLRPDIGQVVWIEATGAREEGRLAALVGDTVGAIQMYRRYLNMRRYAEPALIPQRDSVRAELGRLEGRR